MVGLTWPLQPIKNTCPCFDRISVQHYVNLRLSVSRGDGVPALYTLPDFADALLGGDQFVFVTNYLQLVSWGTPELVIPEY